MQKSTDKPLVEIRQLTKRFGRHTAVQQLSLSIFSGEYVALLGVNGAGKTTLMEMIEGLQMPDEGSITIAGGNWQDHAPQLRQIVGLSLQETRFIDKLTVQETLRLFASFYHLTEQRVEEVLDWINLRAKKDTYTVRLSGGQRQRLALGISLLHKPQLLLLDEPTTGLDPHSRRELWELLLHLKQKQNMTLLLTTHYLEEAEQLCERIIVMDNGQVVADGRLEELLSRHTRGEFVSLVTDVQVPAEIWATLPAVSTSPRMSHTAEGFSVTLEVAHATSFLSIFLQALAQHHINLLSLQIRRKNLEDLFISLTGKKITEELV